MIWRDVAGHCVSRADKFAENTLYTVDLGRALYSFTLYFTTNDTKRVEIIGDAITVGWPAFKSRVDERVMIESVVHMITGYYMTLKKAK